MKNMKKKKINQKLYRINYKLHCKKILNLIKNYNRNKLSWSYKLIKINNLIKKYKNLKIN